MKNTIHPAWEKTKKLIPFVEGVISDKKEKLEIIKFESEINKIVYEFYGLTEEEIKIVEDS